MSWRKHFLVNKLIPLCELKKTIQDSYLAMLWEDYNQKILHKDTCRIRNQCYKYLILLKKNH